MSLSTSVNTIGVLTSGGDSPGMNAAIRAVVRTAKYYNLGVLGVKKGFSGLLHGDIQEMTARDVSDIMHRGGTFLQTARCPEFLKEDKSGIVSAVERAKYFKMDALVVIGGDGSFNGAKALAEHGLPVVGIPGTIDNDIPFTEYTVGFDTAINTAKDCVDKIRDTATSHERCYIVEVMGRYSGNIALQVGIATGAEYIFIPERPCDFEEDIIKSVLMGKKRNKKHFIFIHAEGAGDAVALANKIEETTGLETRVSNLGYIQRGGSPTARDRLVASQMGCYAVNLLKKGIHNRVIGIDCGKVFDMDIFEALDMPKKIDTDLIDLAEILSI